MNILIQQRIISHLFNECLELRKAIRAKRIHSSVNRLEAMHLQAKLTVLRKVL